ncbi:hypothetical protein ACLBWS_18660 [Brucellaceae bacterium D45D]
MPKFVSPDTLKLARVNPNAAAIDIGSTMHMAAVNPDADDMPRFCCKLFVSEHICNELRGLQIDAKH